MKLWERSLAQALGQADAARSALIGVCGNIMPPAARQALQRAQRELDDAVKLLLDEARKHETDGAEGVAVPWSEP